MNNGNEIDVLKLCRALLKRWYLLLLAFIVGAGAGYAYTSFFKSDTYTVRTSLIVSSTSQTDTVTSSSLNASEGLVKPCMAVLTSDSVIKNDILGTTGLNYSVNQIRNMTSMSAVNDTQVFTVAVTAGKAADAQAIASAYETYGVQTVLNKVQGVYISSLDSAEYPEKPDSKNTARTMALFALLLTVLCAGVIIVINVLDVRIHGYDELENVIDGSPIIGSVPSFDLSDKSRYASSYDAYGITDGVDRNKLAARGEGSRR